MNELMNEQTNEWRLISYLVIHQTQWWSREIQTPRAHGQNQTIRTIQASHLPISFESTAFWVASSPPRAVSWSNGPNQTQRTWKECHGQTSKTSKTAGLSQGNKKPWLDGWSSFIHICSAQNIILRVSPRFGQTHFWQQHCHVGGPGGHKSNGSHGLPRGCQVAEPRNQHDNEQILAASQLIQLVTCFMWHANYLWNILPDISSLGAPVKKG